MHEDTEHIPVPLEHRPNLEGYQKGQYGMTLKEEHTGIMITSDMVVEVRQ